MNSLSCLLCRWNAARCLDDGRTPAGWTAGHLSGCARCRASYEREREIAARLMVKSSDAAAPEVPRFLHDRILANLDTRPAPSPSGLRVAGWASATAAVLISVLALQSRNDGGGQKLTSGSPPERVQIGGRVFAGLGGISGEQAVRALDARLDGPLEGEFRLVVDDARTALRGLSKSFLPGTP